MVSGTFISDSTYRTASITAEMNGPAVRGFIMPILLVSDETLRIVDYTENGTRSPPMPSDETTPFVDLEYPLENRNGDVERYRVSHLHVYTRTGFTAMLCNIGSPAGLTLDRVFRSQALNARRGPGQIGKARNAAAMSSS